MRTRDTFADAARRHAHALPGHILLAAEPSAIPASILTVDVLAEQAEDLEASSKYALRAMSELARAGDAHYSQGFLAGIIETITGLPEASLISLQDFSIWALTLSGMATYSRSAAILSPFL